MNEFAGYKILETVFSSQETIVYRGQSNNSETVILKTISSEYLNNSILASFNSEYEINSIIDSPLIVKSLKLAYEDNVPVIVFQDIGAKSLKDFIKEKPGYFSENIEAAIQLAISIIKGIAVIHDKHVIHKDINPSNIVYNHQTGKINIIDFGLSTELSFEKFDLSNINKLEGSLAYISPEQTGRINRNIDYRTDYYSLGVTLYELFSGQLPFQASNAREWVHCQIAKEATPLNKLNKNIPSALSMIVDKLMEKTAEKRYQSPFGIITDLNLFLESYKKGEEIFDFKPGQKDISRKFRISQKLYGREDEIKSMISSFESLSEYNSTFISVEGLPGSGKSSLVNELYKTITEKDGYFISGKFERLKKDIPYLAFIKAFSQLFKTILTEDENSVNRWKQKLINNLEGNANVVTELIPELELLLGPQSSPLELLPIEAKARFVLTFQKLVDTFADENHPLVLFLDDLQWADQASLDLLQTLLKVQKNRAFLCIGAYRNNNPSEILPVTDRIREIENAGIKTLAVKVTELSSPIIRDLIKDSFSCSLENAEKLATVCYLKTLGNPFFLNTFLSNLYRTGKIKYQTKKGYWDWDINKIEDSGVTNNVIDLICERILELPEETQNALKFASCIGTKFNLEMLSIISKKGRKELVLHLKKALNESLILPQDHSYRFAEFEDSPDIQYKFYHDRVLQATYSLIDDNQKEFTHHQIAITLLNTYNKNEITDKIFIITEHYNKALGIIQENEKFHLSKLNLIAAEKAKASSAFHQSLHYLNVGLQLIDDNCWLKNYKHTLKIHSLAAELAFLCEDRNYMEQMVNTVRENALNTLDKADVLETHLFALSFDHKYPEAIKTGINYLNKIGFAISENTGNLQILTSLLSTTLKLNLGRNKNLLNKVENTNPEAKAALRVLAMLIVPSYSTNQKLLPLIAFKIVQITIKHGISPISPLGFVLYGMISSIAFKSIAYGYKYGQLGMKILKKINNRRYWANASCIYHATLCFWKDGIKKSTDGFMEDYKTALETGNIEYATTSVAICVSYLIIEGENLNELSRKYNDFKSFLQQWPKQPYSNLFNAFLQTIINLQKHTEKPEVLNGELCNEETVIQEALAAKDYTLIAPLLINKLILAYLFGNFKEAVLILKRLKNIVGNIANLLQYPTYLFFRSLTKLAVYNEYSYLQQKLIIFKVKKTCKRFKKWAKLNPKDFAAKYLLLEAEIAKNKREVKKAFRKYYQAIKLAKEKKNLLDEGIAYELIAKLCNEFGNYDSATLHFKKAAQSYDLWGASAKSVEITSKYIIELDKKSLQLTTGFESKKSTTSIDALKVFDIETLMDAANTISREVVLSELIKKITEIMIQHAGAQKGILLLKNRISGEFEIKAEGFVEKDKIIINLLNEKVNEKKIPLTLVRLAINKNETIIEDNAIYNDNYIKDKYVQMNLLKSAMVLPILQLNKIHGVIYLENNLATNVFTPHHLAVLNMLSSQIAISIDNSFLYENLELKVDERTEQINYQAKELKLTNAKLVELDKFKAGMIGMIVHDLKNPLNTILNVSDKPDIIQAGNQMLNMVMNILDIQKFESTQVKIKPLNFLISDCITEAMQQVKYLYERKSIIIENRIPGNAALKGDTDLITRIFVNLLSNAIKFSPNNDKIKLEFENNVENKDLPKDIDYHLLKISDNGEGIPSDKLAFIFDKFYQVELKKSGNLRSTGLGLSYCKLAVEAHGGKIHVSSELGKGSTFYIYLPKGNILKKTGISSELKMPNQYTLIQSDIDYLSKYISELNNYSVYEFSDVSMVLQKIENKSENIKFWKAELENALRACNEEKYTMLIKLDY